MSCLTSKEKEEGVVCIDIGGETSKIVVFKNDNIIFAENLALAGNNVTTDTRQDVAATHRRPPAPA